MFEVHIYPVPGCVVWKKNQKYRANCWHTHTHTGHYMLTVALSC
jgi:hypothetical protein